MLSLLTALLPWFSQLMGSFQSQPHLHPSAPEPSRGPHVNKSKVVEGTNRSPAEAQLQLRRIFSPSLEILAVSSGVNLSGAKFCMLGSPIVLCLCLSICNLTHKECPLGCWETGEHWFCLCTQEVHTLSLGRTSECHFIDLLLSCW